jgi:hypothetical protein
LDSLHQPRHSGAERGQALVVACLVLIYVFLSGSFAVLIKTIVDSTLRSAGQFARVAKLLKGPDCAIYEETIADELSKLKIVSVRFWINAVFGTLAWLLALWYLVSSL